MATTTTPCLCCGGDRVLHVHVGGGNTEPWPCPACKGEASPSWFRTDRDEDSEYVRWDDGVDYELLVGGEGRWTWDEQEVVPADCQLCDRPLTAQTSVPLCPRCVGTVTAHARLEQARIDETR